MLIKASPQRVAGVCITLDPSDDLLSGALYEIMLKRGTLEDSPDRGRVRGCEERLACPALLCFHACVRIVPSACR